MIFSASKGMYTAVLLGEKTLTTRLNLPAHIAVGKEWAIVPKRGAPAWWFGGWTIGTGFDGKVFGYEVVTDPPKTLRERGVIWSALSPQQELKASGFIQARIRIEDFWTSPLGDMTEAEAREDGADSVKAYAALWNAINPDCEWYANRHLPVWRIRFNVPLDVAQAVSRVGKQAILDAAKAVSS